MRKLVWFSSGFAAACLLASLFLEGWLVLVGLATLVLAVVMAIYRQKNRLYAIFALFAFGCSLGICWFCAYDAIFVLVPRVADGQALAVCVEATDYSYETSYGCAVEGKVVLSKRSYRVKAYLSTQQQLKPGDKVTGDFRFRLTTNGGAEEPTGHDSDGIFLLAYSQGEETITEAEQVTWEYYPALWRRSISQRVWQVFPDEVAGFGAALLLGDRSGISYETDTALKVSGVSHVIAVSGLHISILFSLIYTVLAKKRVLSCCIAIPVMFLFAAIAGFTPSVNRACIMQSLMLIALLFDREYDGLTSLAFAVMVMLVINPLTILSVSFQLSVGCMAGILVFSEKIRQFLLARKPKFIKKEKKRLSRLYSALCVSVSVSVSATVITAPLVAYYFGCVSLVSVLTNVLVLWIISFIFYGFLFCLLLSLVSIGFAQTVGMLFILPVLYVTGTAKVISKLPMAAIYTADIYAVVWLIGAYVIIGLFLLQKKKRPLLLLTAMVFTLLMTQLFAWVDPLRDNFRVTMLDVGQGQSILLQSDGKTFLVDCGGDKDKEAANITAETLLSQGISRLDGIILTHYDSDHVGGVPYLLSRIRTDRLILPDTDGSAQIIEDLPNSAVGRVEYVNQDVLYTFGSTEMTIFAPDSDISDNESGICILFRRKDCGILITGDRGAEGETALINGYDLPQVDILVAGHHGSAESTGEELLAATSPNYVFISVGMGNCYGHPTAEVLERLRNAGCIVYRTDLHGNIIYRR